MVTVKAPAVGFEPTTRPASNPTRASKPGCVRAECRFSDGTVTVRGAGDKRVLCLGNSPGTTRLFRRLHEVPVHVSSGTCGPDHGSRRPLRRSILPVRYSTFRRRVSRAGHRLFATPSHGNGVLPRLHASPRGGEARGSVERRRFEGRFHG